MGRYQYTVLDSEFYNVPVRELPAAPYSGGYFQKEVYAAGLLDVELYPLWDTRPPDGVKAQRISKTRPAQLNLNEKNARKRFIQLLNANFDRGDYHITLTYDGAGGSLPDIEQVRRDIKNYLRRWQYARKRAGLSKGRYMYVIEGKEEGDRKTRVHAHIIAESGIPRDVMEDLWLKDAHGQAIPGHGRARAERLQLDKEGYLEGLGRYLTKDPQGKKRWGSSHGLKQPEIRTYSIKELGIPRRAVADMARNRYEARAYVAKYFPGYELRSPENDVQIRSNPLVDGVYISLRLHKRADKGGVERVQSRIQTGSGEGREALHPDNELAQKERSGRRDVETVHIPRRHGVESLGNGGRYPRHGND